MLARLRSLYRERRLVRWTVDLLLVLALVLAVSSFQTRKHVKDVPMPALALHTLGGEAAALETNKKTLVYVWAPWCGVCKAESDNIARVRSLVGDRARVVSVVVGYGSVDEVRRYIQDRGVEYPVLLGDESVERALRVTVFPTIYFVDARGRITRSVSGYTTTAGLLARLFAP